MCRPDEEDESHQRELKFDCTATINSICKEHEKPLPHIYNLLAVLLLLLQLGIIATNYLSRLLCHIEKSGTAEFTTESRIAEIVY